MTNLTELKKLAEAATPGPWIANTSDDDEPIVYVNNQYICQTIYDHQSYTYRENPAGHLHDARFIAAANPQSILQMLALCKMQHAIIDSLDMANPDADVDQALAAYKELMG